MKFNLQQLIYSFSPTPISFVTTFALVSLTSASQPIWAQPAQPNSDRADRVLLRFIQPILEREPDNRGAPDGREGAGTRGGCPSVRSQPLLTSLVPLMSRPLNQQRTASSAQVPSQFVLGLTVTAHPTFWFYVPYLPEDIHSIKFVLLDENKNSVTQEPIFIKLSGTPGIVSVSLPTSEKPLEIGKYYHWYFLMDCKPQSRFEDIALEGLVQRVALNPTLMRQLETATPRQRIALYAANGIWQDALTLLGELYRAKGEDKAIASDWANLLRSVELDDIATEPIVNCCTASSN